MMSPLTLYNHRADNIKRHQFNSIVIPPHSLKTLAELS